MNQRRIEGFTAGCPLCAATFALVKDSVSACGCEVIERHCSETKLCPEAEDSGIRVMPTVVLDGQIVF